MPQCHFSTRRAVHGGLHALAVAALVAAAGLTSSAQKRGAPTHATAEVAFADRLDSGGNPVDGLTSDGGGAYLALVGLEAGDVRLDLRSTGRVVTVRLGAPESTATGVVVPSGVTMLADEAFFVPDILSIPKGTTVKRVGRIGLGSGYPNHALGFRYTTSQNVTIYGSELCVTRRNVAGAVWDISSSCAQETSDVAGLFEENVKAKVTHRFKATYIVPFAATVTCTANCPQ
ncbi:hypothetical protein TBR22_A03510 [Luteitalea sp. TBR-22]|uniref:hypothetical protein n=1 Tax=Luteitalea sp. TBR-22 TaxID=2802971 RepID=UPI001AFB8A5F|nr:hypothetical protein [Luteitalea sp. TBR-22]BCS31151.1 hypothetical protein TBR22_A03510 [Luteitalea sp. TBR-22]